MNTREFIERAGELPPGTIQRAVRNGIRAMVDERIKERATPKARLLEPAERRREEFNGAMIRLAKAGYVVPLRDQPRSGDPPLQWISTERALWGAYEALRRAGVLSPDTTETAAARLAATFRNKAGRYYKAAQLRQTRHKLMDSADYQDTVSRFSKIISD